MGPSEQHPDAGSPATDELEALGARIADAVDTYGADYVRRRVARILDAWGRTGRFDTDDGDARARLDAEVAEAAQSATTRVGDELRELLDEPPLRQRATPLEVVRTIGREATEVLDAAGVAPVVRDTFEERSFPDDAYDLAPRTLGDLAAPFAGRDPAASAADIDPGGLGALQLAWGLAKARALRPPGSPGAGDE